MSCKSLLYRTKSILEVNAVRSFWGVHCTLSLELPLSFSFFMPFCFLVFAPCVWLPSPLFSPYPLSLFLKCCQARDSLSVHLIFRLDVLKCYGYLHFSVIAFKVIHCIFVAQSILHFLVCRYIISCGYHAMLFFFF